jgi:hypothetical protein
MLKVPANPNLTDTSQSFILHPAWAKVFLPTLMQLFLISDEPFQKFINNSPAFVAITQEVLDTTHPSISYPVIAGNAITMMVSFCLYPCLRLTSYPTLQAFERLKCKHSLIASEALKLVKKYFTADQFIDKSEEVKKHVMWALCPDGLAYNAVPTPIECPADRTSLQYIVSN